MYLLCGHETCVLKKHTKNIISIHKQYSNITMRSICKYMQIYTDIWQGPIDASDRRVYQLDISKYIQDICKTAAAGWPQTSRYTGPALARRGARPAAVAARRPCRGATSASCGACKPPSRAARDATVLARHVSARCRAASHSRRKASGLPASQWAAMHASILDWVSSARAPPYLASSWLGHGPRAQAALIWP